MVPGPRAGQRRRGGFRHGRPGDPARPPGRLVPRPAVRGAELCVGAAALGVGWWSSPEIAYFAVPAALWLVPLWRPRPAARARRQPARARQRSWSRPAALGLFAAGVGALPWLWANARTGLASSRCGRRATTSPPPRPATWVAWPTSPPRRSPRCSTCAAWPTGGGWWRRHSARRSPSPLPSPAPGPASGASSGASSGGRWGAPLAVVVVAYPFVEALVRAAGCGGPAATRCLGAAPRAARGRRGAGGRCRAGGEEAQVPPPVAGRTRRRAAARAARQ